MHQGGVVKCFEKYILGDIPTRSSWSRFPLQTAVGNVGITFTPDFIGGGLLTYRSSPKESFGPERKRHHANGFFSLPQRGNILIEKCKEEFSELRRSKITPFCKNQFGLSSHIDKSIENEYLKPPSRYIKKNCIRF
jgi:hypothetical protein